MDGDVVGMSAKERDRAHVIRQVSDRRMRQGRAARLARVRRALTLGVVEGATVRDDAAVIVEDARFQTRCDRAPGAGVGFELLPGFDDACHIAHSRIEP